MFLGNSTKQNQQTLNHGNYVGFSLLETNVDFFFFCVCTLIKTILCNYSMTK